MSVAWYKGSEWSNKSKGLHKRVLDIRFTKMEKPSFVATCKITVNDVQNLNERDSKFLANDQLNKCQTMQMGTALTPVDCYVELLVQQMLVGETADCTIHTSGEVNMQQAIKFIITLDQIEESRDFHTLDAKELYELALRYKQNGVEMFKKYPSFAHDYFARGAKCLISLKPFEDIKESRDGIDGKFLISLLEQLQTNLAACLLANKRFEDVLYHTQFVDTAQGEVSYKAIYRRALAYYNLKEYLLAQQLIESRVKDYKELREFAKLHQQVLQDWKASKEQYKTVVQRMFNK